MKGNQLIGESASESRKSDRVGRAEDEIENGGLSTELGAAVDGCRHKEIQGLFCVGIEVRPYRVAT